MNKPTRNNAAARAPRSDAAAAPPADPAFIVGIGASAGGLESLEKLFQHLAANTGMAFVVIQHLSPDFKSMMFELLTRDTEMPIHKVEDGMRVEANHIYLLPPKKEIVIAGNLLHLTNKDPSKGLALPIDRFFESLARECGQRAVGVILSGSGSDGSRGICEIARVGGLVICESQETAQFDGMPLSAQATGCVDLVVSPSEIGTALQRHSANPLSWKGHGLDGFSSEAAISAQGIDAIFELFRREYDLDFSVYKEATVLRRINRRATLVEAASVDAYADRLRHDREELAALHKDLLIGVTQFFRDAEPFQYLSEKVLPDLIRDRDPSRTLRAWVVGCATGQEAYSLAILFHELLEREDRPINFKLFATDVHKACLEEAGRGIYRESALKTVSPERLKQYFIRKGNTYQIKPELRELIVFAPQNLLRDAPFTDLDFVSCRNLLIYFQPAAQTKALSMLHFGLNTGGVLFLGSSESPGEIASEFETIHERCKLYRKWRQARLPAEIRLPLARTSGVVLPTPAIRGFSQAARSPDPVLLSIYDQLLNRFMPPSLLLDEHRELLDSFGGAGKLLRLQSRRPTLDVLELIDPGLRTTIMGALQRSLKGGEPVRFSGVKVNTSEGTQSFNMTVEALKNRVTHAVQYLLTFEQVSSEAALPAAFERVPDNNETSQALIRQLEDELRYSKENLQTTIEELETSNEELQATNEELVASNEELQSTNEELHSVNEELYTVNAEHQRKISELAEVNQDMHHLLENSDVAMVFLDRELRIRKFTSRVRKVFDLLDQDVGRPIASFTHRIRLDDWLVRLQAVRDGGEPFECEVHGNEGGCYLLRILPYRVDGEVNGVVVTLVDLAALEDLRGRLRWMSAIVESTTDAIVGEDLRGYITSWNAGAERLYGYSAEEALGRHVSFLVPEGREAEVQEYLAEVQRGGAVRTFDTIRMNKDGRPINISLTISPVRDAHNCVVGVSKIGRDVTDRIRNELELRQQARLREQFLAMLSHELRNPLNAVLSAAWLLRDDRCPDAARAPAVETIERQATMIGALLNDLLDVSRVSQGKIELKLERLDLLTLIDAIRETTQPEVTKHSAELRFEMPDGSLWVEGDAARLIQIQVNLIHNAAKYSPPGKPIVVTLRRLGEHAEISVVDQGAGIAAEFLPRIFEPFAQSNETLARAEGGLGVGLTLVKSLVELHGGTVTAYSAGRDLGSTLTVCLPLASTRAATPAAEKPPRAAPVPRRIVLVEDLPDNRRLLTSLLELDGHTVFTAPDGEVGLATIIEQHPDVALIDIGLPGIDGYELARRVREQNGRAPFLVALTGYGQPNDVSRAREAGFDAHLVKPIVPERLLDVLTAAGNSRENSP